MKLREIVSSVHMPCRKMAYVVLSICVLALYATDWLPGSYFFIKYIAIALAMTTLLYMSFWIYRGGYRKQALLTVIGFLALFAISIVVLRHVQLALYGG